MPQLIESPTRIQAAGNKPKSIDEFVGGVNTKTGEISIAHMKSPAGWVEPGQKPDFDEYTLILKGAMRLEYEGGEMTIKPGQAVITRKGEWIRYSTPDEDTEYVAVCLPAFSMDTVHRDSE